MPRLVLIRHGQSTWNLENRFTGWWDVDLTPLGVEEALQAGDLMAARGLDFDLCFTSVQTRAIKTLHLALEPMGRLWLPVEKHWRLNERHYGGLTGLNKAEMAAKFQKDDQLIIETGKLFETVEENQPPSGEKLYVNVVKTPLHDAVVQGATSRELMGPALAG